MSLDFQLLFYFLYDAELIQQIESFFVPDEGKEEHFPPVGLYAWKVKFDEIEFSNEFFHFGEGIFNLPQGLF